MSNKVNPNEQLAFVKALAWRLFPSEPVECVIGMFKALPLRMQESRNISEAAYDWLYRLRIPLWVSVAYLVTKRGDWFVRLEDRLCVAWVGPLSSDCLPGTADPVELLSRERQLVDEPVGSLWSSKPDFVVMGKL
jgi:hypothetical protein